MRPQRYLLLVAGLALLAAGAARADTTYTIQPIIKLGDKMGDFRTKPDGYGFEFGTLNDNGQMCFVAYNEADFGVLIQYADGRALPIVVAGGDGPGGKWPANLFGYFSPVSMNQRGSIALNPGSGPRASFGNFLWDYPAQKFTTVAAPEMPATSGLAFTTGGGSVPVINNRDEVAFAAEVKDAAGKVGTGVWFLGRDGRLQAVALPDQVLPGGVRLHDALLPSMNDDGAVAFLARPAEGSFSAYIWEQGTIRPVATISADLPGGGKLGAVRGVRLNNWNTDVLVAAAAEVRSGNGLYLLTGGHLTAVAVPGQEMPGGGKLKSVPLNGSPQQGSMVSYANGMGQHAFLAQLEEGGTAAYRTGVNGNLSLILKSGTPTELGTITRISIGDAAAASSFGIGLNSRGQVALAVQIDGGPDTIVLLTPTAP